MPLFRVPEPSFDAPAGHALDAIDVTSANPSVERPMGAYCTRTLIPHHPAQVDETMEVLWSDYHGAALFGDRSPGRLDG